MHGLKAGSRYDDSRSFRMVLEPESNLAFLTLRYETSV